MRDPFWKSAAVLLEYKRQLALLVFGSLVGAACYGAGVGMILPMLMLLEQKQSLSQLVQSKLLDPGRQQWVQDLGHWLIIRVPSDRFDGFLLVLATIAVLTLIGCAGRYIHELMTITVGSRAAQVWRQRAFQHLLRMPLVRTYASGSSDQISRLTMDTRIMADGYQAILGKVMHESLKSIAALAMALFINWRLSLVALVAAPVLLVMLRKFGKKILRASKAALSQRGKLIGVLNESLGGLSVVKVHSAEGYERRRFSRVNQNLFAEEMRMRQVKAFSSPLVEMLSMIGVLALMGVASWFIFNANVKPAEFLAVLAALVAASGSVRPLSQLSNQLHESEAAAQRVLELFDIPVEPIAVSERRKLPTLPRHRRSVSFEAVSFTYPEQKRPAVRKVSLDVLHGQTVAIVGANGSGKTTLLNLVSRLLEPQTGKVLIDDRDIAAVNLRSLREQIAVVTQQSVLFEGTIAQNIAYGRHWEPMGRIVAAATAAYADEFVAALPGGYQAKLGEDGSGLSGGQRQRLCIARAILRDPAILILDEATSQIDADSEAKINAALRSFRHGRTTFIIAHRLSTVVDADLIVVMDDGGIVDQGRHDELLGRCAIYRTLNQTQLLSAGAAQ